MPTITAINLIIYIYNQYVAP